MTTEEITLNHPPAKFWEMIERAKEMHPDYSALFEDLDEILLINFVWNYQQAALEIGSLFESSYDFSEDSLLEFSYWVVAQGEKYYDDLMVLCASNENSDLSRFVMLKSDPGINSAAMIAFFNMTEEEVPVKQDHHFYSL